MTTTWQPAQPGDTPGQADPGQDDTTPPVDLATPRPRPSTRIGLSLAAAWALGLFAGQASAPLVVALGLAWVALCVWATTST